MCCRSCVEALACNPRARLGYLRQGLSVRDALEREWGNSIGVVEMEGASGTAQFAKGAGRHGDFGNI
jgi:hypothetical protein